MLDTHTQQQKEAEVQSSRIARLKKQKQTKKTEYKFLLHVIKKGNIIVYAALPFLL